jgi:hypothetical protein
MTATIFSDATTAKNAPKIVADKPYSTVVNVTPKLAYEWLETNDNNRNLKAAHVKALASDMSAGRWVFTGESLQFSKDGRLLNGQHRLHAVIASGETVKFNVVRGLDDDAQRHMDLGAKRSVSDALTMNGYKNTTVAASIGRLALMWQTGRVTANLSSAKAPSSVEVQDFIFADEIIPEAAQMTKALEQKGLTSLPKSAVGTAIWAILSAGNTREDTLAFFTDLAELRTEGAGDPKKALLQRFASRTKNSERLSQPVSLSLILRAWNADVQGKQVGKLSATNRDGSVTIPEPLVRG